MNLSPPEQSMHKPSEDCPEVSKADLLLPCFRRSAYDESLASYHSGSIISHLLRKTIHNKLTSLDNNLLYMPNVSGASVLDSECNMTDFAQDDQSCLSFKDSTDELSSGSQPSSTDVERPLTEHLQAKRARVENIIRGMSSSPNSRSHGEDECEAIRCRRDILKENKRKQRLPQHQGPSQFKMRGNGTKTSKDEECHKLKEQLQSMQRLLHQLQEKISHVNDQNYCVNEDMADGEEECDIQEKSQSSYKEKPNADNGSFTSDCEVRNLQEALKCEVTRTVNDSIDMVFRKLSAALRKQPPHPQPCQSPEYPEKATHRDSPPELSDSDENTRSAERFESTPVNSPEHQTEALSLVVRKPSQFNSVAQGVKRPYPLHQSPFQFGYGTPLHDSQILEHLLKYGPHSAFSALPCLPPSMERSSPDSMEHTWESVAMRSKEGLTPNHLKKAKLMFFYTRYPSSNLLKNFFPDVKFNRCITSQLIKWFSNFREFYYIQMEKFARQAVIDGVRDVKDISVSRESELFRALNMHYNKANDFQVPDRFLEVAEITLQEFYSAISLSKDSDPSWKKAIYKVICKLDSDVPEDFKSPSTDHPCHETLRCDAGVDFSPEHNLSSETSDFCLPFRLRLLAVVLCDQRPDIKEMLREKKWPYLNVTL
ncbi:Prospero homeobox protein 1 Homeobox prospero-like protein PROX1 [Triplophysa tibetana]|uniref:Prospero homeobox protein 1 Homeobox prospero-like protein PROX1 n=1 Tax=Triplophysa tibetana TaxID=1572043 RepID=A0A5A9NTI6_9TELE|nr:Prospero homeobox protein 1 Homeobox prospero-like protein PROX1 [Triplophysa tibetana]